jgi:hypothetical protein
MTTKEFIAEQLPRKPHVESNLDKLHRETAEMIEENEMLR